MPLVAVVVTNGSLERVLEVAGRVRGGRVVHDRDAVEYGHLAARQDPDDEYYDGEEDDAREVRHAEADGVDGPTAEEVREAGGSELGDVAYVALALLGGRVRAVLGENGIDLPARHLADDADDTASAVLEHVLVSRAGHQGVRYGSRWDTEPHTFP